SQQPATLQHKRLRSGGPRGQRPSSIPTCRYPERHPNLGVRGSKSERIHNHYYIDKTTSASTSQPFLPEEALGKNWARSDAHTHIQAHSQVWMSGPEREELLLESHSNPALAFRPSLRCKAVQGAVVALWVTRWGPPFCFLLSPSLAFVSHLEGRGGLGGRKSIHVPPTTWVPRASWGGALPCSLGLPRPKGPR
ncbi:mCG140754, partial [Mus musculus]